MPSALPPAALTPRRLRRAILGLVIIIVATTAGLMAWTWYPTTLQPDVTLTNASYTTALCYPVLTGGYANRYDWTFTLLNSGGADGDAWVLFSLDGVSQGYREYPVAQHSSVVETGFALGPVYATNTDCGPSGTPALALGSVTRLPPLDEGAILNAMVTPAATVGFAGLMFAGLWVLARRRGISLLADMGPEGWGIAILVVFAANLMGGFASQVALASYHVSTDWTSILMFSAVYSIVAVLVYGFACRAVLRAQPRGPLRGPQ